LTKAERSGALLKTRQPQTLPGPYSPGCYADDNDYNLSASDPQHISVHQYAMQAHFKLLQIQLRALPRRKTNNVQKLFRRSSPDMVEKEGYRRLDSKGRSLTDYAFP
jgi:hypothetical protein